MKKTIYIYLGLLLLSVIHIQSSCVNRGGELPEPKPKELPPITTEGRNTIGFLLNGEVWLPGGGGIGRPNKDFILDTFSNVFYSVIRSHTNQSQQTFSFRINWAEHICYEGEQNIFIPVGNVFFIDFNIENGCIDFEIIHSYKINIIHCDLDKQIISGTFEMEIENDCGDIYSITEGRFDSNFRYY